MVVLIGLGHYNDRVQVRNGSGLKIARIGSSTLTTPSSSLKINEILHVPRITKNLLSISKLTKDNDVYCEFHAHDVFLLRIDTRGRLYFKVELMVDSTYTS